MYLIPLEIGVYIWDGFRIISNVYVVKNAYKLIIKENNLAERRFDYIVIFLTLNFFGFFFDAYLNNSNWLIQLFLFQSFIQLKKGRKGRSGLFFFLAAYKINVIIFPIMLVVVKIIKFKDLKYYFLPWLIACIPYVIFPSYFLQMLSNWIYLEGPVKENMSFWLELYLILWQAFQTAQLMYVSLIFMIFFQKISVDYRKWR